ncbi:16S rRNA (guanine(966)-N(2))-methyltransferase RsmD [Serinibacter arcticus]|uniref:16S rRNA (Guanine(966)-N(2))-methyltransferase n=1 Tax=Serinibacter arcticus TaxID=1655435 RepID=A0A4Z1E3D3_9MICO|nr:16S rRNA (guanine(966)-N(2))-methyltransferase RsmD [Serinibacter arcticus]TGO04297.1 16S rRNA (guanine(966)-N(2))-methyltransferase [Serinibacter arcticus]
MARIIAGTHGGRTVAVPAKGTRPTTDRVREALFARLDHDDLVDGVEVLDLYAGSGALGLEAASRGASRVVLVEAARQAAQVCRDNVTSLGLSRVVEVVPRRVEAYLASAPSRSGGFGLVFVDPPYEMGEDELARVLDALVAHLDEDDAVVVVERSTRSPAPTLPPALELWQTRTYGETALHLLHPATEPASDPATDPTAEPTPDGAADVPAHDHPQA